MNSLKKMWVIILTSSWSFEITHIICWVQAISQKNTLTKDNLLSSVPFLSLSQYLWMKSKKEFIINCKAEKQYRSPNANYMFSVCLSDSQDRSLSHHITYTLKCEMWVEFSRENCGLVRHESASFTIEFIIIETSRMTH